MTYIHAPVNVILPRSNGVTVEFGNPERVVPIPSGAQGLPGEPGFSPIVSVEPITGGNRVTITDEEGDTTFDVMNGAQGEQGEPGEGVPTGGVTGQVLKKRSNADYDTYWANESGTVLSVNGMTGEVVLDADDVGALPDDTFIPTKTSDLTNDSGFTDVHVGASAPTDPDTQIWLDTDEPGQSAVTSVNGATGTVVLDADDVGAMSKWTLLWTNASPSSSFSAQTVSLDLSDYDAIMAEFYTPDFAANCWAFGTVGAVRRTQAFMAVNGRHVRNFLATSTGVEFSKGEASSGQTGGVGDNNGTMIPQRIYGIKGVLPL